jgi:hypothetical protein
VVCCVRFVFVRSGFDLFALVYSRYVGLGCVLLSSVVLVYVSLVRLLCPELRNLVWVTLVSVRQF